jgi:hypothetical protein
MSYELDALVSAVDFASYRHAEQEAIESMPSLGFYEPGTTVSSILGQIRAELPFSDDELSLLCQTTPKWDQTTGDWNNLPSEAEGELIARWHDWLRDPDTADENHISLSARRIQHFCEKLSSSLDAHLPRR